MIELGSVEYEPRIARQEWPCDGDGRSEKTHAEGCRGLVRPDEFCFEILDETPAYASGPRVSCACAEEFYGIDVEAEKEARFGE